ncbi:ATP-binding cassette domain-containing protein [Campylobacter curvus]|uniref:ATP-binding cassette domain-containing protein n=1 Tax=Campylobacter curvus TaxID=200 RepID=UPI00147001EC
MEDLLKIKNAAFYYESGKFLFRGLNFSVKRGEILSILGLNGQGKSTLMFCMMGVFALKEGEISGKAKFAFLPQSFNVAFDYSVLDIVLMGRIREISIFSKPSAKDIEICKNCLDMLEISHLIKKSFNSLSGGQRQLVLFARAMASNSDVLFLDEPTSALDLKNQDRVLSLIKNLKEQSQASIVFTTHQPNHALAVANNTLILKNDLSYEFGKSHDVLTDENLSSLYDVDVRTINFSLNGAQIPSITQIFTTQKS